MLELSSRRTRLAFGCASLLAYTSVAGAAFLEQQRTANKAPRVAEQSPPAKPATPPLRQPAVRPQPPSAQPKPFQPAPMPVFSVEKFGDEIAKVVDPNVVGWAYSIAHQKGKMAKEGAGGDARTKIDGQRSHSPTQRQNVASVSKIVTAAATMQLLDKLKLSVDAQVSPFLVGYPLGPNMTDLTFSDVMRHCTGITSTKFNSVDLLKYETVISYIKAGVPKRPGPGLDRTCAYDNMNYALLRLIIPQMWAKTGADLTAEAVGMYGQLPEMPLGHPDLAGNWTAYTYIAYVQKNVFAPIGVKNPLCSDQSATQTLYYSPEGDKPGEKSFNNDWTRACGSGGWYLSARDLTTLMTHLFHSEKVISKEMRKEMVGRWLGMEKPWKTTMGSGYSKDGSVGPGIVACVMHLPIDVEASLVMNSGTKNKRSACSMLKSAYEAAWVG